MIIILPFGFRRKVGAMRQMAFVSERRFQSDQAAMAQANSLFGPLRWKRTEKGLEASVELFYERHWS